MAGRCVGSDDSRSSDRSVYWPDCSHDSYWQPPLPEVRFAQPGWIGTLHKVFDPTQGIRAPYSPTFRRACGHILVFVTDMHHVVISGYFTIVTSCSNPASFADQLTWPLMAVIAMSDAFSLGVRMGRRHFLVFGLIFYVGVGVLSD